MSAATWFKKQGKSIKMFTIPMVFMFSVTMFALILLVRSNIMAGNYILVVIGAALFILAIILAKQAYGVLSSKAD
jgi:carbon starvation protein